MYQPHPLDIQLADVLPPGSLYSVGGRVRDELRSALGASAVPAKDLDYVVTGVGLEELTERLGRLGRVDLVGAAFAVAKLTVDGLTVDVALPRRERSTGTGHREFEVQSGPDIPLADDLARRDFRMNMIARALPGGALVDPYGGEADIRAHRVDILTAGSFEEDPLRMLRAAQFAARFSFGLTEKTRAAMRGAADLVRTVAAERIHDELNKLFELAPKPSIGLRILAETGILEHLWPELLEGVGVDQNEWHAYDVWEHNLATLDAAPPGDITLRLAALLHDVGKPRTKDGPHFYRHEQIGAEMAVEMLRRVRYSTGTIEAVEHLIRQHMYVQDPELSDAAVRRFIRRIGPAHLQRQFAVRHADIVGSGMPKRDDSNERFEARIWEEMERQPPFTVADLAVNGDDVIAAMIAHHFAPPDYRGDARVGAALQWLFEQVTDHPERNEREVLLALLDGYLAVLDRAIG